MTTTRFQRRRQQPKHALPAEAPETAAATADDESADRLAAEREARLAADAADAAEETAQPSFTPAPPAMTGPQRAIGGRPYLPVSEPPRTFVYEAVAAAIPLPPPMTPDEAARLADAATVPSPEPPGTSVMLYSEEGWTRALSAHRISTGEWEDWPAIVEQGFGRNAAQTATAYRHARRGIAAAWREFCHAAGHPEWTDAGLRRIHEFVMADREDQERRATDTEAFRALGREDAR